MLVIFDWDGTLIDSTAKIVLSMQQAAKAVQLPVLPDEVVRNIIGLGLPEAILTLYPDANEALCEQLKEQYSLQYIKADQVPCALYQGVDEGLKRIQEQGHYIAVATGKSRQGLSRVWDNLAWHGRFDASRCADETASKPDPLMLNEIIQQFDLPLDQVLMVGDTEFDLAMATNAGVKSIGVSYGAHTPQRLLKHRPLAVIDRFDDLFDWIEAV